MPTTSSIFHALQQAVTAAKLCFVQVPCIWAVPASSLAATNGSTHSFWHNRQLGSLIISQRTSYAEHPGACYSMHQSMGAAGITSSAASLANKERTELPTWKKKVWNRKRKKALAQEQQRLAERKARRDGSAASSPVTQWVTVIPRQRTHMPPAIPDDYSTTSRVKGPSHPQQQVASRQKVPNPSELPSTQADVLEASQSATRTSEPLSNSLARPSSNNIARKVWALQAPEFVSALNWTTGLQSLARLLRPLLLEEALVQQITSQSWKQHQQEQREELQQHIIQREHAAGTLVQPVDYMAVLRNEQRHMTYGRKHERHLNAQSVVDMRDIKQLEELWGLHAPVNLQGQAAHESIRLAGGLSLQALTVAFHVLLKHTRNALSPTRVHHLQEGRSQDPEVMQALAVRIHAALCNQLTYLAPVMDMKGCAAIAKNLGLLRHIALPSEEAWSALATRVTGPVDRSITHGPVRNLRDSEGNRVFVRQMYHVALIEELLGVACGAAWLHQGPDPLWHALARQVTNMAASKEYNPFGKKRRYLPCVQLCHTLWALSVGADSVQPAHDTKPGTPQGLMLNRMETYSSLKFTKSEAGMLSRTLCNILDHMQPEDVASARLSLDKLGFPITDKLKRKLASQVAPC